jgi:hypothetical protein
MADRLAHSNRHCRQGWRNHKPLGGRSAGPDTVPRYSWHMANSLLSGGGGASRPMPTEADSDSSGQYAAKLLQDQPKSHFNGADRTVQTVGQLGKCTVTPLNRCALIPCRAIWSAQRYSRRPIMIRARPHLHSRKSVLAEHQEVL